MYRESPYEAQEAVGSFLLKCGEDVPMTTLRRLLSILLLASCGLPFISPLFAFVAGGATSIPTCCRRDGKHHCLMATEERSHPAEHGTQVQTIPVKCPYCPAGAVKGTHPDLGAVPMSARLLAGIISQPATVAQVESKWRIARDRSRQKRGPPSLLG